MRFQHFVKTLVLVGVALLFTVPSFAQERKVKDRITPAYPEMAKAMHLAGTVKVQITITPQGVVKDPKVIGGHPLLADAALRAIAKWKYEAGPEETQVVQIDFKKPE